MATGPSAAEGERRVMDGCVLTGGGSKPAHEPRAGGSLKFLLSCLWLLC